ncbi:MAG: hypothetical protein KatS3mg109_0421 [Pirellulaceae bacterium]|nr:MAG: hypothetical protein KatS3mg109_0421 [Pirellulaceae bacterium]
MMHQSEALRIMLDVLARRLGKSALHGPLANERELHQWIADCLGVVVPDKRVCHDHVAPLTALADAYFATSPRAVWLASRSFGGKSVLLSCLVLAEAATLGAGVTLLGGSLRQSKNVHDYMQGRGNMRGRFLGWPHFPREALTGEPLETRTRFATGGWVEAYPASTRAVRGPHPQRLRGDEIDELDARVWDAATGQPVSRGGIATHIVASSTLQYPDGTMARELKMAAERGWPVWTWCYRETSAPGGFLSLEEVARKRQQITEQTWLVEFELQEPAVENRAINTDAVDRAFDPSLGTHNGELGASIEFEPPESGGRYATGVDWGKRRDKTIIWTIRTDTSPARLVAYSHLARTAWPMLVSAFEYQVSRYPGMACYDLTGLGTVVEDLIRVPAQGVTLTGLERTNLFQAWIAALEHGQFVAPRVVYAYREHRFCSNDDLFGRGHPPDSFVAAALAWRAATRHPLVIL